VAGRTWGALGGSAAALPGIVRIAALTIKARMRIAISLATITGNLAAARFPNG